MAILRTVPLGDTDKIIRELEKVIDEDWNSSASTENKISINLLVATHGVNATYNIVDHTTLEPRHTTTELAVILLAYSIVFSVSVFANILVCHLISRNRRLHTVTNAFLVNLAVSDLFITFVDIPFNLLRIVLMNWIFGDFVCRCVNFLLMVSVYVSTFTMAAIAVDRYLVILHPFRPRITVRVGVLIVLVVWTVSVLMSLPFAIFARVQSVELLLYSVERCRLCYPDPEDSYERYMTLCTFLAQFLIPILLTALAYGQIVQKVWSRQVVGQPSEVQHLSHTKTRKRTIKMLILVVAAFSVCWLPLNLYHLLTDFHPDNETFYYNSTAYICFHWLAVSSVCYNPFIYCWLHESFRKELRASFSKLRNHATRTHAAGAGTPVGGATGRRDLIGYCPLRRHVVGRGNHSAGSSKSSGRVSKAMSLCSEKAYKGVSPSTRTDELEMGKTVGTAQ